MNDRPEWTRQLDLASRVFGATVMWASDELFAEKENLVNPWRPRHQPETFGPRGQLYDGWETRRHRETGDDSDDADDTAIVRLGLAGVISGIVVDTAFFKGNYPPRVTVEACAVAGYPSAAELRAMTWEPLAERAEVTGDSENFLPVRSSRRYTHVRLTMHPDGGVARLRVHGVAVPDPALLDPGAVDLAAAENGATCVGCSDMFYSSPSNMLAPGLAAHQAEGWETARRRDEGNDWAVIRLAAAGVVRFAELDTSNLRGNAPGWAALSWAVTPDGGWHELLPKTRLQPDTRHRFPVTAPHEATHVRLDIYPDGGLARLRLLGGLTERGRAELAERFTAAGGDGN
ncbi:allantoicase [Prauserella marina]|uniref:Probable allantoicase n=1 Tax=Prauserella marina TaxID=530584 RepID=A0A222VLH8_9PSEU|nr:allantoicase [Prauserella marina]ASR34744.1 allantoicase [Prauserella marina]PWV85584.1 allantoicase [Prauserella marina]SDC51254.1 allantoicase [Prauserella marina]